MSEFARLDELVAEYERKKARSQEAFTAIWEYEIGSESWLHAATDAALAMNARWHAAASVAEAAAAAAARWKDQAAQDLRQITADKEFRDFKLRFHAPEVAKRLGRA